MINLKHINYKNNILNMSKLTTDFIILQYQSGIESYSKFTTEVGLWDSMECMNLTLKKTTTH